MRLLRLCESEGHFHAPTYLGFRDHISLAEALEIEAAMCVIGDHRAEYVDFYKSYEPPPPALAENQTSAPLTHATLRDELAHREQRLAALESTRLRHRAAIAYAASGQPHEPQHRLPAANAAALDRSIDTQRADIARVKALIVKVAHV